MMTWKTWKRILLAGAAVLVLLVGALAAAPLLFRDRIEARVKAAIDGKVDARVTFGDVGLSLFRSFPNLSFSLRDLTVTGVGAFDGDTLAHVDRFRLVVDLGSAVRAVRDRGALVVRSIIVDRPYVHARVLEDGRASWDILKAADEAAAAAEPGRADTAGAGIGIALRRLAIHDGRIAFDDAGTGLHARVSGLEHELEGDFTRDRFTIGARTDAGEVTVRHAGVPYLTGARVQLVAAVDADMEAGRFTVRENQIAVNELALEARGTVGVVEDGVVDLDITFAADRAAFRDILSLVPALYLRDYEDLRAAGTVAVSGHVKGRHGADDVPAFGLELDVTDGMFHYADLPLPVEDIGVRLAVTNPGGDFDHTAVDLTRFDLSLGGDDFHATAALHTPVSDPEVRLAMNGRIDLAAVRQAVPLEGVAQLRGTVTTDAEVHTRLSWLEAGAYDRVEARGLLDVRDVAVSGEALPHPVAVDELRLVLAPAFAELQALRARAGASDLRATGRLDNLLGFALRDEELRGRATIASGFIALDEWRSGGDTTALAVIPVPANLDLALSATIDSMTFGDLTMADASGELRVKDRRLTLQDFTMRTLGGDIVMSGWYETLDPERPAFDFDFAMRELDIPGAFAAFNTVRALAPAAGYATGEFSADLDVEGVLGSDMMPVLDVLDGIGEIETRGISIEGMPALNRLADAVRVDWLRDPTFSDFASSIEIRDGRLHVRPFDVRLGDASLNVAGSNGIDRSLDYRLALELPRDALPAEADRLVAGLLAESGRIGVDLGSADAVRLDAGIGGTMRDPTVRVDFGDALASAGDAAREQVEARVADEVERAAEAARARAEEARLQAEQEASARAEEARARARAEADEIIAEAEARAARVRAEAADLAERTRAEGYDAAARLEAEATNPLARRAAKVAADRLRREADERAAGIVAAAEGEAERLLAAARTRADALLGESGESG